jgi:hypothetical protein
MPSNPTPEEREAREQVVTLMGHAPEIWSDAELERIADAYARAVYERGVRDAMERTEFTRSVYTNTPYSDFAQGWHEACDAISRLLRTLTPTEARDAEA